MDTHYAVPTRPERRMPLYSRLTPQDGEAVFAMSIMEELEAARNDSISAGMSTAQVRRS